MRKLLLRSIGPLGWLLSYAWFVVVGKTECWLDFEFHSYDGPNSFLYLLSKVSILAFLSVGMLPVAAYMHIQPSHWWWRTPKDWWRPKDYLVVLGLSAMLVFLYLLLMMMVFGTLSWPIGWISEDAANAFIRFTTIMCD